MATPRLVKEIAHALVTTAQGDKEVSKVVADLATVSDVFQAHPDLLASLRERSVPLEARSKALREALKKDIHSYVTNALLQLQHADLLDEFPTFFSTVVTTAQEIAKHHEVKVRTAVPLEAKERKELAHVIEKKFDGTHRIHETVDPRILGGLIVDVGDWHLDASIKGKLERLKQALRA